MLADTPINLCVTSETLRATETAEIALAGRGIPLLERGSLNDPPAGDFEDGPVEAFADWISENGEEVVVPGAKTTIAGSAQRFLDGARFLLELREDTVLVVAHAPVLRWLHQTAAGSSGRLNYRRPLFEYAQPFEVSVEMLRKGVQGVTRDPAMVFRME